MQIVELTMRGFTTFKKPIYLKGDEMGPGVFAIVGGNGEGKTTLMDCMGPILYRIFPSRNPNNPADYVDKKRGAEATMIFKVGPLTLKAELKISPKGKQDAVLYAKKGKGWKALTTGKLKDYDEQIEKLLGPLRANLASVFGQQGGGGGFESLKAADRKRLFRWYLGLDMVDEYYKEVKEQLKSFDADKLKSLEGTVKDLETELLKAFRATTTLDAELVDATTELERATLFLDEVMASSALTDKALRYERLFRQSQELALREANLKAALKALGEKPELVDLDKIMEQLNECDSLLQDVDDAVAVCDEAVAKYDSAKGDHEAAVRRASLIDKVPCKGKDDCAECGFLLEAIAAKKKIPELVETMEDALEVAKDLQAKAKEMVEKGESVEEERQELLDQHRDGREAERKASEQAVARAKAEEARSNVIKQIRDMIGEMDELEDEIPFDDEGEIDWKQIATPKEIDAAKKARDETQKNHSKVTAEHARATAAAAHLTKNREAAKAELEKYAETAKALVPLRLLEDALGPNGFPIYEIDAAGPEVTGIINDLLQSCYGERFKVAIRTLSPKKTGGFKEDFDFIIRDTKADEDRALGQMSGGEKTIVGEAVRIGFALYQAERGTVFQTMLRDEAEGSLSPDNARRYVAMLARARDLGEFHQIFFITHSPDAAACADGAISVKNGEIKFKASEAI